MASSKGTGDSAFCFVSFFIVMERYYMNSWTSARDKRIAARKKSESQIPDLMLARGTAIQAYAYVESCLSSLLARLLKTDYIAAGTVFLYIVNTRSRNAILKDLFKMRFKKKYSKYWQSLMSFISRLDAERNEIVHWHTVINYEGRRSMPSEPKLMKPDFWNLSRRKKAHTLDTIQEFTERCHFVGASLTEFESLPKRRGKRNGERVNTWREIFSQPIVYPPPRTHPLYQTPQERKTQRESSEE